MEIGDKIWYVYLKGNMATKNRLFHEEEYQTFNATKKKKKLKLSSNKRIFFN